MDIFKIDNGKYEIPCNENFIENAKAVVIACHGFKGGQDIPMFYIFTERLSKYQVAFISFDLPGHGRSIVDSGYMTWDNFLEDLFEVYKYAINKYSDVPINLFGTSLGADLVLTFLEKFKDEVKIDSVVCKSTAINLEHVMKRLIAGKEDEFHRNGSIVLEGHKRVKLTKDFYNSMLELNISDFINISGLRTLFVHGTEDLMAPIQYIRKFCSDKQFRLVEFYGAKHGFTDSEEIELAELLCNHIVNGIL